MTMNLLKIAYIRPNSEAERAGLAIGDLLYSYNNHSLETNEALAQIIQSSPTGGTMSAYRKGVLISVQIQGSSLGITTIPLDVDPAAYIAEVPNPSPRNPTGKPLRISEALFFLACGAFFVWLAWPTDPKEGGRCNRAFAAPPGFICR